MEHFERIYLRQDLAALVNIDLPEGIRRAWELAWAGCFGEALACYDATNLGDIDSDLAALAAADRELLATKIGQPPARPRQRLTTLLSRFVYDYAQCWHAFWNNRQAAKRSLRTLTLLALGLRSWDALRMCVFLRLHLATLRKARPWVMWLQRRLHRSAVGRSKCREGAEPFCLNVILAAYPYALFVSDVSCDDDVAKSESLLSKDPGDRSVFNIGMLYRAAYAGDLNAAEIFAQKLKNEQVAGGLRRYQALADLIALLPLAMRGYTQVATEKLESLLGKTPETLEPIVRCEYWQIAAVVASIQGNHERAVTLMAECRLAAQAGGAPEGSERISRLIDARGRPHWPAANSWPFAGNLGGLVAKLPHLVNAHLSSTTGAFVEEMLRETAKHVGCLDFTLQRDVSPETFVGSTLVVDGLLIAFNELPKEREEFVKAQLAILQPILRSFAEHHCELRRAREQSKDAAAGAMARQVAHDIRSPLAALKTLAANLNDVCESKRLLLHHAASRIDEIANDLLAQGRQTLGDGDGVPERGHVVAVFGIVDQLLREKQLQCGERVHIAMRGAADSYDQFVRVDPSALKRALSNLINNAVEAIDGQGEVAVHVAKQAGSVQLSVEDSGKGIPEEVLAKLMKRGATYGKKNGNGLGLASAAEFVRQASGSIDLRSKVGHGTSVVLTLPTVDRPEWFVPGLRLTPDTKVFVVDDDASIHALWRDRLSAHSGMGMDRILSFTSPETFSEWWEGADSSSATKALVLCDQDLRSSKSGLQMILDLGLEANSVLVTNHEDDAQLLDQCARAGVRVLPKSMARCIPIA